MLGFGTHRAARRTFRALLGGHGAAPTPLARLLAEPAAIAVWDVTDRATLRQDAGGAVPVAADGQPVGRVADLKGVLHFVAPSNSQRPLSPARFDGSGDEWRLAFSDDTRLARGDFIIAYRGTDQKGILLPSLPNVPFEGVWDAGDPGPAVSAGSSMEDLIVDDISFRAATRGQLASAVADGAVHVVELIGVVFSDYTGLRLGNRTNFEISGQLAPVAYLDGSSLEIASARQAARSFAQEVAARLPG
ncbi:hypothetical protein [Alteriqipengyuania lutimaris]|uniref:Uncharacterized protein n=1 Tax=Alteriqipengyuania lutimaris TaxID=1538146 RepID=A0A395LIC3_9SPHN|nr:hypothetical protein [Alteriqipengyuania lutimaris]MBB3034370.1 hypothetical protein [Alteriqipengyuania lutimaris]RDS76728.1 hypothetical protein DL238_03310 [Alteriqipengyuania lutimaris]